MVLLDIFKPMPKPDQYPNILWSEQHTNYETWMRYYTGEVLDDTEETEDGEGAEKFPLKINICRQMVKINAYAILGEWQDKVFNWRQLGSRGHQKELEYLETVSIRSFINSRYISQILTHTALGGMVWKVSTNNQGLQWSVLPPEFFYPVYTSMDDELLECLVSFPMTGREAQLRWPNRIQGDIRDVVIYQEHWTKREKVITVDDIVVERKPTIDGIIPYVYVPRVSLAGERYGESLIDSLMGAQDELNYRLADLGDAVHRETHKPIIASNLPAGVRGIDEGKGIIDLGMGLGRATPTIHNYKRAEIPSGAMDLVKVILDFARYDANTPPVAFGEDEGSQRSSLTLSMRMWPLLQSARTNRAFIADGMTKLANITLRLAHKANIIDSRIDEMGWYAPDFPAMLPKDREQAINEVATLWNGGTNPLISPEMAMQVLERPEIEQEDELERLAQLKKESEELAKRRPKIQTQVKQQSSYFVNRNKQGR